MASLSFPKFSCQMNNDDDIEIVTYTTAPVTDISDITISGADTITLGGNWNYADTILPEVFITPDDPLEVAQFKLSGVCPTCKTSYPEHKWGCPEDPSVFDLSSVYTTINTMADGSMTYDADLVWTDIDAIDVITLSSDSSSTVTVSLADEDINWISLDESLNYDKS